jgi:septum site-determining protein MinC
VFVVTQVEQVRIKGIREGLLITLGEGGYSDVLRQLTAELKQKQAFLQGSRVALAVGDRSLDRSQLAAIQEQLGHYDLALWAVLAEEESTRTAGRELGLATRLPGSATDLDGNTLAATESEPDAAPAMRAAEQTNSGGLLLKETLRSGRSIYHEGHVVVIGDVNPGAEIIAGGDVIVWGRLRGLVHAGALGDETAVICALELNPTQLRIAGQIAIPPEGRQRQPIPEQVAIRGGQIVAEPWQTR